MTIDIFDGDPLITLDEDGADMIFNGGQPVMDQGFLNHNDIALLTESGHWSDDINRLEARRPRGNYLQAVKKPITRQSLIDDDRAAEADLKGDEYKTIQATTTNPTSQNLFTDILLTPPTNDPEKLRLERTGQNWVSQATNPQNEYLNA